MKNPVFISVLILQASCTDWTFEEIIIQARRTDGSQEPVGTFTSINDMDIAQSIDYGVYKCPLGSPGSTVGTLNSRKKILPLTITWRAPTNSVGSIHFLYVRFHKRFNEILLCFSYVCYQKMCKTYKYIHMFPKC